MLLTLVKSGISDAVISNFAELKAFSIERHCCVPHCLTSLIILLFETSAGNWPEILIVYSFKSGYSQVYEPVTFEASRIPSLLQSTL